MKKLLSAPLLGLIALMMLVTACGTFSVAKRPEYADMIGKEYTLQRDCYIFRYLDRKGVLQLAPVGTDTLGFGGIRPDENIDPKLIGKKFAEVEIMGAIPKHTVVKVVDVKHVISFEMMWYEVCVEKTGAEGTRQVYRTNKLQKKNSNDIEFDERFAIEKQQ